MSPQLLVDRLPAPPSLRLDQPWSCRLTLEGFAERHDLRLDGAPYGGEHLPAAPCTVTWRGESGREQVRVEVAEDARPSEARQHQLRSWAELTQREFVNTTTEEVTRIPVLSMGAMLDDLELKPLDDMLRREGLNVLRSVAQQPRSWLRYEDQVLPVDRAQRMSRNAERDLHRYAQWAAYHNGQIMLQRVLAEVTEDQLDLYENQVFTSLLRLLLRRAQRRLARCRSSLTQLQHFETSLWRLERLGQFRRQERKHSSQERRKLAQLTLDGEATRAFLESQVALLQHLLQSDVARACPQTVWWPLRDTNALSFDRRYRELPALWRQLREEEHERTQLNPVLDDPDRTYSDYALVACCHALREAGFRGSQPDSPLHLHVATKEGMPSAAHESRWESPGWSVKLTRAMGSGTLVLDFIERQEGMPSESRGASKRKTKTKGRRGTHHAPGAAVTMIRARHDPCRSRLIIEPTFTPLPSARPEVDDDAAVLWLRPVTAPGSTSASTSYFGEVAGSPNGQIGVCTAAPWRFDSLDNLGRVLRRFTLWFDVVDGRIPDRCPACGKPGRCSPRGDWSCNDEKCGVRWGKRDCGECGTTIPKVLPKRPPTHVLDDLIERAGDDLQSLADELGGRELLAGLSPTVDGLRGDTLICPGCGSQ